VPRSVTWDDMDREPRTAVAVLRRRDLPDRPGVYALYKDGKRMYVGKATSLRTRVGGHHRAKGASMSHSALRRNICELLGIATAADIKAFRYLTTLDDASRVTAWLHGAEFAWIECESPAEALLVEEALRREAKPPLNRR
jgi:excinuclease UvrABC nuclease subunit